MHFLCYDAACKLVGGVEAACPGLLENEGVLQRDDTGQVVFPELAPYGNNRDSATRETTPCTPLQEPERGDTMDVYALMEASGPRPGLQSEVDPHEALYWGGRNDVRVGGASEAAATRAFGALWREGVRILSLFEVIVFSYNWHRHQDASGDAVLGMDGWVRRTPSSPDESSPDGESGGNQQGSIVSQRDAADFLLEVLVSLSGSRQASMVPKLPVWLNGEAISAGDVLGGLREYAKVRIGEYLFPGKYKTI